VRCSPHDAAVATAMQAFTNQRYREEGSDGEAVLLTAAAGLTDTVDQRWKLYSSVVAPWITHLWPRQRWQSVFGTAL